MVLFDSDLEGEEGSYLSHGYFAENERNTETHLLQFRHPAP